MNEVTKFFEDNINRLQDAGRDPMAWNLNCGLLALAKQMNRIESQQADLERQLAQLAQQIRYPRP